ncbi:hypothetical protein SAMN05518856_103181 [Paenibacillus sp. OK003]|nr:hypothetical protein SAMN05518856_103181 [Paenibacillus sp. OK003]
MRICSSRADRMWFGERALLDNYLESGQQEAFRQVVAECNYINYE